MKTSRVFMIAALALALCIVTSQAHAAPPPVLHQGVINVNTAKVEQLMFLPRIGEAKAQRIVAYRSARPFKKVVELARVKGIGLKTVRNLKQWLRIQGKTTLTGPVQVVRRDHSEPPATP